MASTFFNTVNIFLGTREANVTFCIDISGSMYSSLKIVKEQLIQYLLEQSVLADLNVKRLFNLIAFSTEVYPWANNMVLWQTATVNKAIDFIKDLETKTGTNTLDALLTAFQDENCHSVVLVTDDISDQEPYQILNQVSLISRGRPVHCIYISNGREEDRSAIEFLQNLSTITRGSFKIVSLGRYGVEKITPINSTDHTTLIQLNNLTLNSNSNPASVNTTILNPANQVYLSNNIFQTPLLPIQIKQKYEPSVILPNYNFAYPKWLAEPSVYNYPSFFYYPKVLLTQDGKIPSKSIAWSRYRPVKVLYDGQVVGLSLQDSNIPLPNDIAYTPDAGSLLINRTVVARSSLDGFYYKGKVMSQILAHRFMVQFGPNTHGKYKDCFYQDTAIYDIIHYDDTINHPIKTNDKVLALIDGVEKYSPCEVLEGFEAREDAKQYHMPNKPVTVRFSNGKTRTIPENEALWLPDAMYERIKFEMNLPSTARKYLEEHTDDYPLNSLPGYPTTNPAVADSLKSSNVVMPRMVYDIWPYFVPFYPLYSNILYSAINTVQTSNSGTSLLPNHGAVSMTPTYFRSMRTNPASVDADLMNKSVVGTLLTPDELDVKIRKQIHNNRHLIESSNQFNNQESHPNEVKRCNCEFSNSRRNDSYSHSHNQQRTCNKSNESLCSDHETLNESDLNKDNKYYQLYVKLVQELFNESKNDHLNSRKNQNCCSCSHDIRSNGSLQRSKSVTFSDNDGCDHDHEYHDLNHSNKSQYINDRNKKNICKNSAQNVPRFLGSNVHIGLPDRPLRRPRSASANMEMNLTVKSSEDLREKFHRENTAIREKAHAQSIANEIKKQESREQYHKNLSAKMKELENKRTENVFNKSLEKNNFKKEHKSKIMERIDSNKIDVESKEQTKIAYLREQANKRNTENLKTSQKEAIKEANKLGFKRAEQNKRNQVYHDRLLIEEAIRKTNQEQALISHSKQLKKENYREAKGQKEASMNKFVNENNSLKLKNNIYNSF